MPERESTHAAGLGAALLTRGVLACVGAVLAVVSLSEVAAMLLLQLLPWAGGDALITALLDAAIMGTLSAAVLLPWMLRLQRAVRRAEMRSEQGSSLARRTLRQLEVFKHALDQHSLLAVTDAAGRILEVNDSFCRLSQYTREELVGQTHRIVNSGVHPKSFWEGMWGTITAGRTWHGEVCNRAKDGTLYWVSATIVPVHDEQGVICEYIAIRTDISERKRAEEDCLRLIQMQDEMGRVARVGGWEFDPVTGRGTWTREMYSIFELDPSCQPELESSLSHFPGPARAVVEGHVQHALATGEPFDYTVPLVSARGRELWVRGRGHVAIGVDGAVRLYGALQDVTESQLARQELLAALEDAQSATRAKSDFLANMSHEIRTPLTAILGYTDLLDEIETAQNAGAAVAARGLGAAGAAGNGASPGAVGMQRAEAVRVIRRSGQHLLGVIDDILDLSKIEAGKMAVESIEVSLPALLLEVESLLLPRCTGKGLTFALRLDTPVPERILSDPLRVRQMLMNLAGNAVKFTEAGGVTLAARVEAAPDADTAAAADANAAPQGTLVLSIEDSGPGLNSEQAARLFEPFSQADASVTRRHGGSGLGLVLCRRFARLLGGEVQLVRSAPGQGSEFALRLPLLAVRGARRLTDLRALATPAGGRGAALPSLAGRILLAEDGTDNQRLIAFILRKAGATVDVAAHGRLALVLLEQAEAAGLPYDLLLTDMQMPEMDGYTLARTLRERGSRLSIVALTAHAMATDEARCLAAGCDAYATKPIDRLGLLEVCANWLGRPSPWASPGPSPEVSVAAPDGTPGAGSQASRASQRV